MFWSSRGFVYLFACNHVSPVVIPGSGWEFVELRGKTVVATVIARDRPSSVHFDLETRVLIGDYYGISLMMDKTGYAASDLFGIHGRTALITGGTSGIGYMMAEGLVVNGIGILVITGLDDEDVIIQKTKTLQTLADENDQKTVIFGSDPCIV